MQKKNYNFFLSLTIDHKWLCVILTEEVDVPMEERNEESEEKGFKEGRKEERRKERQGGRKRGGEKEKRI